MAKNINPNHSKAGNSNIIMSSKIPMGYPIHTSQAQDDPYPYAYPIFVSSPVHPAQSFVQVPMIQTPSLVPLIHNVQVPLVTPANLNIKAQFESAFSEMCRINC
jgi:hypothetical protein